jgi:hypothetical protein
MDFEAVNAGIIIGPLRIDVRCDYIALRWRMGVLTQTNSTC